MTQDAPTGVLRSSDVITPLPTPDVVTGLAYTATHGFEWGCPVRREFRCEIGLCPEPEGGYSVYSPELPGVVSEGENAEEAVRNIVEALQGALQTYLHDAVPIPWKRDIEPVAEGETRLWIVVNV